MSNNNQFASGSNMPKDNQFTFGGNIPKDNHFTFGNSTTKDNQFTFGKNLPLKLVSPSAQNASIHSSSIQLRVTSVAYR